ncbi:glycoside hydrolase family 43 protein [Horticoccus sp. 23ND18S-11]|uniref:glycoside hydrolase family 43 protein n=1 Tax=Horticoccus sp. 23ND18S-11 TaxID=3391832 RepID=UPI0039C914C0
MAPHSASPLAGRTVEPVSAAPWYPDLGDGRYRNPVLFADYSDPDAIRVGDDYWLTSSSFTHVPGLPILHSRDLVNWTLVNHALPVLGSTLQPTPRTVAGIPAGHFDVPRHGGGVWAPSLRHHAGRFWLYYPDPDFGLYLVTAVDPRGAWSQPVLVKGGKGLIDPCPLWDDDGQAYLVHGWAKSRSGKNNLLTLNQLSADGSQVTDGDGVVIVDENNAIHGMHTLEGPKLYKRGATYWIFAPVGGVATGSQAVYRSKHIRGPYERRIVLAQGATTVNGPHQGAWVDTPAGESWFLHFQDRGAFGRVVHLQPLAWREDGWPELGTAVATGEATGEPVLVHEKPAIAPVASAHSPTLAASDTFDLPQLGLQWQWPANPRASWYSLTEKPGVLRLQAVASPAATSRYHAPNLLLQKFPGPAFTAITRVDFSGATEGTEAGLIVFGSSYAWIGLRKTPAGLRIVQCVAMDADKGGAERDVASVATIDQRIFLRVSIDRDARCRFAFSLDEGSYSNFGDEFPATAGRWVGAKVGLFAACPPNQESSGHVDFGFFRVTA